MYLYRAATRFFQKALHSTADVAPQAHPVEEQRAQPATAANPATSDPHVINVDKNAAYPQAIADLKAAGVLPDHVELRQVNDINNMIEQDHRAHQTLDEAGDGLFLVQDGVANTARIRDAEHDQEKANTKGGQR